jgi:D-lactate dehydratase
VLDCVRKFSDSGKPIGSICHGHLILAAAGSVKGRKCTALHALGPVLIDAGAHWIEPKTRMDCVADGNIITGVIYRAHPDRVLPGRRVTLGFFFFFKLGLISVSG